MPYHHTSTATNLLLDYAPFINGKTILVTGVSPGSLGDFYVKSIAKARPACLILAGRSAGKLEQCARRIHAESPNVRIKTLEIDLGSLESVRKAADQVNGWEDVPFIDVLVNNAGIMAVEYKLSIDGFESHFATNHLGPFLFTNLIMKKVLNGRNPRIVIVSSDGHRLSPIRFYDYNFDGGKTYNKWVGYGQSKTANMLMALSLAKKLGVKYGLQAYSLHPGQIMTNLGSHLDWNVDMQDLLSVYRQLGEREGWQDQGFTLKTLDQGTATHIYASFDPTLKAHNGAHLVDSHIADPMENIVKPWAMNAFEAEKLWVLSEQLVGQKFPY
ncbi:putative short-chain dehydrogenase [Penicillium brasilianum]|uniref:Putative short-chain dehydrogenase n=1 Tax=Penicillium brasilianum TaxID=104259 RepID=A0A1S9RZT1_PENBI|nr:putative short-chain dehydrogenase [Penicillium brasilianum]